MSEANSDEGASVLLEFIGDDLDPMPLAPLFSLKPVGSAKKGQPLGRTGRSRSATAKVGYCAFSTSGKVASGKANEHVVFLLGDIVGKMPVIREIMSAQSLEWRAVLFEGEAEGETLADVDPALLRKMAELGLPYVRGDIGPVTFVIDGPSRDEP